MQIKPLKWKKGKLFFLDQTKLPLKEIYIPARSLEDVHEAIRSLRVRGAPLIGIAAAFGLVAALKEERLKNAAGLKRRLKAMAKYIASSRPTAVNLAWALERMKKRSESFPSSLTCGDCLRALEREALSIYREDLEMSRRIGDFGSALIRDGQVILTHCNAGGLATSGLGTALSPLYAAHQQGKKISVYADETRPLLQGARLTSFELKKAGIPVVLITDSMAAFVLSRKKVSMVIVGADRIVANGDTANKIGTLGLAVLCSYFKVPFYVAAPRSTFDLSLKRGDQIPIEERNPDEVRMFSGVRTALKSVDVYNPAFDVTPASLITAFITDCGLIYPPFKKSFSAVFSKRP